MIAALVLSLAPIHQEPVSYHQQVAPVLMAKCAGCHRPGKAKGKLDLTTYGDLMVGGRNAEVVVPGKPDASLLIEMVTPLDDGPADMPPEDEGEPLTEAERALIARWISEGAKDDTPEPAPREPVDYGQLPIVTGLAVAGDILAVTGRGEVLLYNAKDQSLVARLAGESTRLEDVSFSPDGKRLAVAGGTPGLSGELQVWDVEKQQLLHSVKACGDTLYGARWSMDGTRVSFGGPDRVLRAIDAASGEQVLFQMSHEDWVLDTVWSTDDSHLVSVSRDRSMNLVEVSNEQFIDKITSITPGALKGGLMAVDRHPTKDELLIGGADGVPKIFRMYREKKRVIGDDYNLIRTLPSLPGRVFDVAYSADGELAAAVSSHEGGGLVRVSKTADGKSAWSRDLPAGQYALAFGEGKLFAAGFDGVVRRFNAADGVLESAFNAAPLEEATQ